MRKGTALAPLLQMLMDTGRIGVIGAGKSAKATAFMYSGVVAPTASLRHDGVARRRRHAQHGRAVPAVRFWPRATARCLAFSGGKTFAHLII